MCASVYAMTLNVPRALVLSASAACGWSVYPPGSPTQLDVSCVPSAQQQIARLGALGWDRYGGQFSRSEGPVIRVACDAPSDVFGDWDGHEVHVNMGRLSDPELLEWTVAHEFGHAMGLGHYFGPGCAVMRPSPCAPLGPPTPIDAKMLCALYPSDSLACSGSGG